MTVISINTDLHHCSIPLWYNLFFQPCINVFAIMNSSTSNFFLNTASCICPDICFRSLMTVSKLIFFVFLLLKRPFQPCVCLTGHIFFLPSGGNNYFDFFKIIVFLFFFQFYNLNRYSLTKFSLF